MIEECVMGQYYEGKDNIDIILNGSDVFCEINGERKPCTKEDFEVFQDSLKHPWSGGNFTSKQITEHWYQTTYVSVVYDFIWIKVYGYGPTIEKSTTDLIENIMLMMCGLEEDED